MAKKFKIHYVFNILAILTLIGSIVTYMLFKQTRNDIININQHIYIDYIENITDNITHLINRTIKQDLYNTLKTNTKLKISLEKELQLLLSKRYRYIYVVDKPSHYTKFRFLLDSETNLEDKSELGELYEPTNIELWNKAYKSGKAYYFQNKNTESVWMTYLKPIVLNNKVQAMIVIDFSLQGHDAIVLSLSKLDNVLEIGVIFTFFIFIAIVWFAYIDNKRVKEILNFNKKLEETVKIEVEKNRQKDQQMVQQSRLAQMGEMISMIAHQWRQPLAAISSTSEGLKLKAKLRRLNQKQVIELADNISNYSSYLSSTIDDFRNFFKPDKVKENTSYSKIIDSVLGIIEVSITNKNIILEKNLHSDIVFYTYPNEIKQVLLNLIKNAEDVLLERNITNPTITIESQENILTISDNAGGIPDDIIEKVFDPYFSTKTKKDGTGLGLYMSKTIIEEHCNGKLTAYNNTKGAVFQIELNDIR